MLSREVKTEEFFGKVMKTRLIPAMVLSGVVEVVGFIQNDMNMVLGGFLGAVGVGAATMVTKIGLDLKDKILNHIDKKKKQNLNNDNFNLG